MGRRGCTGKRGKYRNKKVAAQAAANASRKHRKPFHWYKCRQCGAFHLSSTEHRDMRFRVYDIPGVSDTNGRLGRLWFAEDEDSLAIERFVDRAWFLTGLDTRAIPLEA